MQGATLKLFRSELIKAWADAGPLDEWKQTKLVRFLKWSRPFIFILPLRDGNAVGREGVVKVGYCSDVPRVTGHGARKEGVRIADEVGNNKLHEFLWEPGGLGWACGGRPRDGTQLLASGLLS